MSNTFKLSNTFSRGEKEILGGLCPHQVTGLLKAQVTFFMLLFFVVSVEKRITKQMLLVFCGYFFWKTSSFLKSWERRWSLPPVHGYPWHVAYRYNHKSYVIRLKTDDWQCAVQ